MNDMLMSVVNYGTGRQSKIAAPSAGKTGTSQNSRDAWFVGYTSNLVAGVWLGNDDNSPMHKVGGGGLPAIIWKDFMKTASKEHDNTSIAITENDVKKGKGDGSVWTEFLNKLNF